MNMKEKLEQRSQNQAKDDVIYLRIPYDLKQKICQYQEQYHMKNRSDFIRLLMEHAIESLEAEEKSKKKK